MSVDVPPAKLANVGVQFVHGMGEQQRADTLIQFGEPCSAGWNGGCASVIRTRRFVSPVQNSPKATGRDPRTPSCISTPTDPTARGFSLKRGGPQVFAPPHTLICGNGHSVLSR